jgi:hypothetical protein
MLRPMSDRSQGRKTTPHMSIYCQPKNLSNSDYSEHIAVERTLGISQVEPEVVRPRRLDADWSLFDGTCKLSTAEAEYYAASLVAVEIIYLRAPQEYWIDAGGRQTGADG